MKIIAIVMLGMVILMGGCQNKVEKADAKKEQIVVAYINTFQQSNCDKLTLELYEKMSDIRDGKQPQVVVINDEAVIQTTVALLKELPDKGDVMIKMGNVQLLKVTMHHGAAMTYFHYYGSKIKTPDTSFYSETPPEANQLYELFMEQF